MERYTESDPLRFMHEFESIYPLLTDQNQINFLRYLQAKALISLNQQVQAEAIILELLAHAIDNSNHLLISQCNLALSICYRTSEKKHMQKPCLDIAYKAALEAKNKKAIIESLMHIGSFYHSQNDRILTLEYYTKAENLCQSYDDIHLEMRIIINIGTVYYQYLEYHKALDFLSKAFELSQKTDDYDSQLLIINNISTLYTVLNRFNEADAILQKGLLIATQNHIEIRRVLILFNLGVLDMRQDKHTTALEHFTNCKSYAESIGFNNPHYTYELFSNMSGCYRYLGQTDIAWKYLEICKEIAHDLNDTNALREIELNMANLLLSMGKLEEAKVKINSFKKYAQKHKKYDMLIIAQQNLADYYEKNNNFKKANEILKSISPIYIEYMSHVMNEKTKEVDGQINDLILKYDKAQQSFLDVSTKFNETIFSGFVGQSSGFKKVLDTAMLAAQHPTANVLITGESGSGKEIIANIIHLNSIRFNFPFVPVNVSAVSKGLLESEFFGHKKGAFTSAMADHSGYFVQSNNGTLYLDEIGDMPTELQAKLLRVLETRKVTPVGSSKVINFDCRIISSTNKDLLSLIKNNEFRLDLYHRLNTIEIHIPPLRSRPEDIELLINYYVDYFAKLNNCKKPVLENSFLDKMKNYSFPGNVRELKNIIERIFIMFKHDHWDERVFVWLPETTQSNASERISLKKNYNSLEKDHIIDALLKCDGKQKEAAQYLNMSESTLTRRIVKYKLELFTRKGR